jgi:hypothetical protein
MLNHDFTDQLFDFSRWRRKRGSLLGRLSISCSAVIAQALSRRIIGIVPDIDNTEWQPRPASAIYHPNDQDQFMASFVPPRFTA